MTRSAPSKSVPFYYLVTQLTICSVTEDTECLGISCDDYTFWNDDYITTGIYVDAKFGMTVLTKARFFGCHFENVKFIDCTFHKTIWADLRLEDVTFKNCLFEEYTWCGEFMTGEVVEDETFKNIEKRDGGVPIKLDTAEWVKQQQQALDNFSAIHAGSSGHHHHHLDEPEKEQKVVTPKANVSPKKNKVGRVIVKHPYFDNDSDEEKDEDHFLQLAVDVQADGDKPAARERERAMGLQRVNRSVASSGPGSVFGQRAAKKAQKGKKKDEYYDDLLNGIEGPVKPGTKGQAYSVASAPARGGFVDGGRKKDLTNFPPPPSLGPYRFVLSATIAADDEKPDDSEFLRHSDSDSD